LTWLRSSTYLIDNPMRRTMRWIVLFITLPACLALIYFGLINIGWVPLLLPGYFLWKSKEPIDQIHRQTEHASQTLAIYARLFNHLEAQNWEAQSLKSMARRWVDYKNRPSKWISNLSFAIAQLNVRSNFFAIFFNLFGLWDFHWVYRLEKIKVKIQDELDDWFDILATTEALCSLANLSFNNPEWAIPALSQIHLNATELGHPLISPDRRVCNDLAISQRSDLKLITGSNMAGKSTFLRTVGVNLVLAGAGGPVCASSFEWKPVGIFTSMRTVDALNENASTFYAELSRLKTMLDMVKEQDCLVLLDEILKGTNSGDRHKGSEALIKQLIGWQAIGLIATHDLALTHLEKQFPCRIENWYFDVSIRDDELVFDYQVKRGICQSFNATLLMRKMGIEID
ncbi:MAG: hypothetical protein OEQ53_07965, partial [Saprospiraceae bacterium]|nr:hypothetical protein [Saprospiraceae bacterium]